MFPTNSERLIGISDAFSAFVYGYPSSCPRAQCTPNKSVTTLSYTRRHGPVYTGHACMHLPSTVPWISEDRLLGHICFLGSYARLGHICSLGSYADLGPICSLGSYAHLGHVCSRMFPSQIEPLPKMMMS